MANRYHFDSQSHTHRLDGRPLIGTTTALSIIEKPLAWWASGMACEAMGWLHPKKANEEKRLISALAVMQSFKTPKEYLAMLDKAYRAHNERKEKKADEGIDLHKEIETFIKCRMNRDIYAPLFEDERIAKFIKWADENVAEFIFSELHCYSERLYVGGIADFGYKSKESELILADIKSSKKPYFSHWAQLGAYDLQITENKEGYDAEGNSIFKLQNDVFAKHAIFCAGHDLGKPFFNLQTDKTKRAFEYALGLYKAKMFFEEEK